MKPLLALFLLSVCSSCTTLENRRDLYDPDREIYPKSTTTTTTTTVQHEESVTLPSGGH